MTLKQLRENAKLTQEQLADSSGVHQTTISQLETGRIKNTQYATVAALAAALATTPDVVAGAIAESQAA